MSKESADITPDWDRFFPGVPPIGSELRVAFPERWVRFHSLPGSKRYPDHDTEYRELFVRHNTILGDLAHPLETVTLVTSGYSSASVPIRSYPELLAIDPQAKPWLTVLVDDSDDVDVPVYWHFFASEWEHRPGMFDSLVRLIADEIVSNVLIVASDYRWVLHPYDGGMDVITESTESRQRLVEKYANWRSPRVNQL